jgi:hypothetical protein
MLHDGRRRAWGVGWLLLGLAAACGGHSSPVEPDQSTLLLVSVSPADGTPLAAGSRFQIMAVVRYHLGGAAAAGPAFPLKQRGGLQSDVLRANGTPLNFPDILFELPLFQQDGTVSIGTGGIVVPGAGPEVLFRVTLFTNGSNQPVDLTVHYPVRP